MTLTWSRFACWLTATVGSTPQLPTAIAMVLFGKAARTRLSRVSYWLTSIFNPEPTPSQSKSTPSKPLLFTKFAMFCANVPTRPGAVSAIQLLPSPQPLKPAHWSPKLTNAFLPDGLLAMKAPISDCVRYPMQTVPSFAAHGPPANSTTWVYLDHGIAETGSTVLPEL